MCTCTSTLELWHTCLGCYHLSWDSKYRIVPRYWTIPDLSLSLNLTVLPIRILGHIHCTESHSVLSFSSQNPRILGHILLYWVSLSPVLPIPLSRDTGTYPTVLRLTQSCPSHPTIPGYWDFLRYIPLYILGLTQSHSPSHPQSRDITGSPVLPIPKSRDTKIIHIPLHLVSLNPKLYFTSHSPVGSILNTCHLSSISKKIWKYILLSVISGFGYKYVGYLFNPRTHVQEGYGSCSFCLSVCLSVKSHLTSGASVHPENSVTYSTGNRGPKICGVFSGTAPL